MIRRTHARRTARRRAFTIVELMVVTVVVLILMSILVTASSIATETVRLAKAQGDHMTQERAVLALLKRDLQYDHFLEEDDKKNLGRRLSDQRTDQAYDYDSTPTGPTRDYRIGGYKPPRAGYFFASSAPVDEVTNFSEGTDSEGFYSSRSGNHALRFTVVVPGGAPENRLVATVPFTNGTQITGTCGDVAYFLVKNVAATPSGVATYKLVRRWRLAARNSDDEPAYTALLNVPGVTYADASEVMAMTSPPAPFKMLTMRDLTLEGNRVPWAMNTTYRTGEDILHHNVTSFEVKFTGPQVNYVAWPAPEVSGVTTWPRPFVPVVSGSLPNTDYPYDNLPYDGKYDTFNSLQGDWDDARYLVGSRDPQSTAASQLKRIRITGAMIRLRCWSPTTKTTRQTTMTVDL